MEFGKEGNELSEFAQQQVSDGCSVIPDGVRAVSEVLCGCGSPELAWRGVADYLCSAKEPFAEGSIIQHQPNSEDPMRLLFLYLMSHLQLTDHGTSVFGSWLTESGAAAAKFLAEHGPDWQENGRWIDREGTYHGRFS